MIFYINFLMGLLTSASVIAAGVPLSASISSSIEPFLETSVSSRADIPEVPFYSQFHDIHAAKWQKLGCGIASLAMLIEFYQPEIVSVDALLEEGIAIGAFINGAGWSHRGLALLAGKYGLKGVNYDLSGLDMSDAFTQFEKFLKEGPVIASVYYKFNPKSTIPHLAVINGIKGDTIYYNDPAGASAGEKISVQDFMKAWKKRFIAVRP